MNISTQDMVRLLKLHGIIEQVDNEIVIRGLKRLEEIENILAEKVDIDDEIILEYRVEEK